MYRRVSAPIDDTTESRVALELAAALCLKSGCPLDLVHVVFPPSYGTELYGAVVIDHHTVQELREEAQRDLDAAVDAISAQGVVAKAVMLEGVVPSALADYLRNAGTDLVVMTTHDRGRLERLLLGSVSESVTRYAHVPVLLVRQHGADAATETKPSVAIRRILVPLDGSEFSAQIVPHATALARLAEAEVTLLGVLHPSLAAAAALGAGPGPPPLVASGTGDAEDASEDVHVATERRLLERVAQAMRDVGLRVNVVVDVHTQPARSIVEYATAQAVDVIAMTTHGRGAVGRLVAGSVSTAVLRSSPTAMLLYRPDPETHP